MSLQPAVSDAAMLTPKGPIRPWQLYTSTPSAADMRGLLSADVIAETKLLTRSKHIHCTVRLELHTQDLPAYVSGDSYEIICTAHRKSKWHLKGLGVKGVLDLTTYWCGGFYRLNCGTGVVVLHESGPRPLDPPRFKVGTGTDTEIHSKKLNAANVAQRKGTKIAKRLSRRSSPSSPFEPPAALELENEPAALQIENEQNIQETAGHPPISVEAQDGSDHEEEEEQGRESQQGAQRQPDPLVSEELEEGLEVEGEAVEDNVASNTEPGDIPVGLKKPKGKGRGKTSQADKVPSVKRKRETVHQAAASAEDQQGEGALVQLKKPIFPPPPPCCTEQAGWNELGRRARKKGSVDNECCFVCKKGEPKKRRKKFVICSRVGCGWGAHVKCLGCKESIEPNWWCCHGCYIVSAQLAGKRLAGNKRQRDFTAASKIDLTAAVDSEEDDMGGRQLRSRATATGGKANASSLAEEGDVPPGSSSPDAMDAAQVLLAMLHKPLLPQQHGQVAATSALPMQAATNHASLAMLEPSKQRQAAVAPPVGSAADAALATTASTPTASENAAILSPATTPTTARPAAAAEDAMPPTRLLTPTVPVPAMPKVLTAAKVVDVAAATTTTANAMHRPTANALQHPVASAAQPPVARAAQQPVARAAQQPVARAAQQPAGCDPRTQLPPGVQNVHGTPIFVGHEESCDEQGFAGPSAHESAFCTLLAIIDSLQWPPSQADLLMQAFMEARDTRVQQRQATTWLACVRVAWESGDKKMVRHLLYSQYGLVGFRAV